MTRTQLAVHAHPDDESTSTGGVLAHYASLGVRIVLVTCTSGELGGVRPVRRGGRALLQGARQGVLGTRDAEAFGVEDFIRARATTGSPVPESDLFAGLG